MVGHASIYRKSKLPLTVVYLLLLCSLALKVVGGLSVSNQFVHSLSMATFSSVRCDEHKVILSFSQFCMPLRPLIVIHVQVQAFM